MSQKRILDPNEITGKKIERSLARAFEPVDTESRTVQLAFASAEPCPEWFGNVILDMEPKSVRLERMNSGAPLLVNHDFDDQIGCVVKNSVTLDPDGVARCAVKFSRSARGTEIMTDVQDGIREGVSFQAMLHSVVLESEDETGPTYRALDWEPFEVTIAAVPKDFTVGVNRSQNADNHDSLLERLPPTPQIEFIKENKMEPENDKTVTRADEDAEIMRLAKDVFGDDETISIARDHVAANKTAAEFRGHLSDLRMKRAAAPPQTAPPAQFSEKEKKQYSLARAIMADADRRQRDGKEENSFEREVSETLEKTLSATRGIKTHGGILVPTNVTVSRAGLDTKTPAKGGSTVYTEYGGSLIEMLRNRAMVMLLGATVMPGLQGNVSFPRQASAGVAYWVSENPGVDVPETNILFDSVVLSPKTLQATTSYSRQLLIQSVIDVDSLVAADLTAVHALAIDRAAVHGAGVNEPLGIYNAPGVNAVPFAGPVSFAKLVEMESEIAADNADIGTMAYLTTPRIRGRAKQTAELANTINQAVWRDNLMNGYRAEASNQVRTDLGAGNNEHGLVLGVWSQLLIGEWGAMEIITDPYRLKKQGMIEVTSFNMVDIQRRHDESFCKATGLTAA